MSNVFSLGNTGAFLSSRRNLTLKTIFAGSSRWNPEAPALLVGGSGGRGGAERADGSVSHIVEQTQGASRRQHQPIGEGIAQVQVGRGAIVLIGGDGVGGLVETLGAVTQQAVGAGACLAVINAVAAANDGFIIKGIGETEARLEIFPIRNPVRTLARRC